MSCQQVREFLDAYIDRELDVVTTSEFERHLNECITCRAVCEQYQHLHDSVKAQLPYFRAPKALEAKIRARIRSTQRDEQRAVRREWLPHWRGWAIAATLATLLVFSGVLLQISRRPAVSAIVADQVVSSHIRSLMANHLVDVPSSDQHTVKPWFSGRLDFAPVVKDLAPQGFPLIGGRLDYVGSRPVAAIVYKRRQHTINLFIWPSSDSDDGPREITINGYNVVHGTRSHMAYWAVSDLNAGELKQFVQELNN